jgi:ureidoacrylate peracid hydrolase
MQNCFVYGYPISAPEGPVIEERINRLAAECRDAGILVIHTSHVFRPDGSNLGVLCEINPIVKQGLLNKGSTAAALHNGLVIGPRDLFLDKPRFGAFHATDLEMILRSRGIDSVIISGIATNICCEMTAREASVRDFRVFFLSDATATFDIGDVSSGELQKATCATISLVFGQVLTTEEMIRKIETAS